ncbi:MAG: serine protease [Phycisphaerae bacterium]|nr:serine protease [Phycisphaerae bacterium]
MSQTPMPRSSVTQDYYELLEEVKKYVVRIETPAGHGTGFVVYRNPGVLTVATAYHVVENSYKWNFPITIAKEGDTQPVILPADPNKRFLEVYPEYDLALLSFPPELMPKAPDTMLPLVQKGYYRKPGCEVGWCGYPVIPPPGKTLCFFGGWLSTFDEPTGTYFVDGTVINGVSGGPCFCRGDGDRAMLVGIVTAFYPSYSMGQPLQGLGVVQAVEPIHGPIEKLHKSWEEQVKTINKQKVKA